MKELKEIWGDVIAFADPFTDHKIRTVTGKSRLELVRNGREVCYEFLPESGAISSKHRSRTYSSLKSLLASDEFANIQQFVETQRRKFEKSPSVSIIPSKILANNNILSAQDLMREVCVSGEKTRLVLLDGPAGVGKTFQVDQLARNQAAKFLSGSFTAPILHITSMGRRLSNFKDVLAATTQSMGAAFSAAQVAILVRHSLLIAAIDGFDELVDADGYEDAWTALREFIDEVGDGGVIILAARDTFVEEQELLERINRSNGSVSLSLAHIQPVDPVDAKQWLSKAPRWKVNDIESDVTNEILREGSYALRPFFLKALAEAGGWNKVIDAGLRTYLCNSLIWREATLIAQQLGGVTAEIVAPALKDLFQEVALEMAARETDSVETAHLGFLTQYCFEGILDEKSVRKLMHKAGSFSLLESSLVKDKRQFPHSEIQHYFLGGALIKSLENKVVPSVLRRSTIGGEQLDVFAEVFTNDEDRARKAVNYLSLAVGTEIYNDSFGANGGAILILSFSLGLLDRLDYISVVDAIFASGNPQGEFLESEVSRLNLCGANVSRVIFKDVNIGTLVVDSETVFGKSMPRFDTLEIRWDGGGIIERDPERIREYISKRTFSDRQAAYAESEMVNLLERIVRRAVRYFYLREYGDDDDGAFLLKDTRWSQLRGILERHHRIDIIKGRAMHGRPSPLVRIVNPKQLLDYDNPETRVILDEVVKLKEKMVLPG